MINLTGLIFSFITGKGKEASNLQALIARSSLITSTFFVWLLMMNAKPDKQSTVTQKLLEQPSQIYKTTDSNQIKLGFAEDGLVITDARAPQFATENILEEGFAQINFLDEDGNFVKWDRDFYSVKDPDARLNLELSKNPNWTKFQFNFTGKKPKYALLHYRVPEGQVFQSNNKTILGLTKNYLGSYFVFDRSTDCGITKSDVWAKLDLAKADSVILINTTTKVTELEKFKPVVDLTPVLRLNSGMFGIIKRFVVYYLLVFFEKLNDYFKNPLIVILLMVLISRLLLIYPNYRSHIFTMEFSKITGGASGKDPEVFMKQLKNQKVSFKEQALWLILRVVVLLLIYMIIQVSPSFYKSRFLWINDLSKPDSLNLLNLVGLSQLKFLPTIGLIPLISTGLIFFELLRKKQAMEPRLLYLFFVITLIVFSRMQSALCLYIAFSNILDQIQTALFGVYGVRRTKKRGKALENKW
jgi:membrane protein insertase Oxa1/YidC/SpoIIIJ